MQITKKMLEDEIKVLKKASSLHAKYSISQYKQVLKALDKLEAEKMLLEQKVKERTQHLEVEIKQKQSLANELEKIAKYDQLTGLANRYLFLNELELILDEAKLLNKKFALFFIDLDGFKFVNDTYGHEVGDELLQVVSNRIKSLVRSEDLVSRLGGDEFTIILKNIGSEDKLSNIAQKVINKVKEKIKIDNLSVFVGASIGIYIYNGTDNSQDIVSKADIAMYEAKKSGKGKYIFFGSSMQDELQKTLSIKTDLKNALKFNEFVNYFQPIVSSVDFKIKGVEVLIRWKKDNKIVPPDDFVHILEDDIQLITEVTFWQIEEVVKVIKDYDIFFSINISAKLLNGNDLILKLKELLKKYKFNPAQIFFELTETTLSINLLKSQALLKEIKELGFNLSLDDFGTGYSSLAYIREFPFDTIKIDKKFLDNIELSKKDEKLLLSIINMAEILDMKIVLEGIEAKEQLKYIKSKDYIKYQGFYFYKPAPKIVV